MESSSQTPCRCTVCAKLPLKQSAGFTIGWGFDDGTFEFLMDRERDQDGGIMVDEETANKAAAKATTRARRIQESLIRTNPSYVPVSSLGISGISENQDDAAAQATKRRILSRVVAPFEWDEIGTGVLLGRGGFSSVYEIVELCPVRTSSRTYTPIEQAAREFLATHTVKRICPEQQAKNRNHHGPKEISRYAIKFMRQSIAEDARKFRKAAEDLAQEAQLLVALDHPNIISIRGWSRAGPEAYKSGKPSSYFMILDRLPETLEDQMWTWRRAYKKYKGRCNFIWGKEKYVAKLEKLLVARVQAVSDVASAIEYMHSRRIINRDIKTDNVGFDVYGDIKVFDLGLSRLLPNETERLEDGYQMSCVGTRTCMAPEVRNKEPYDLMADVYSVGVVLWQILSLSTPPEWFGQRKSRDKQKKRVPEESLPICYCWPEAIAYLIVRALDHDPKVRPTMTDMRSTLDCFGMKCGPRKPRRRSTFRREMDELNLKDVQFDLQQLEKEDEAEKSLRMSNQSDAISSITTIGPESSQFSTCT